MFLKFEEKWANRKVIERIPMFEHGGWLLWWSYSTSASGIAIITWKSCCKIYERKLYFYCYTYVVLNKSNDYIDHEPKFIIKIYLIFHMRADIVSTIRWKEAWVEWAFVLRNIRWTTMQLMVASNSIVPARQFVAPWTLVHSSLERFSFWVT